MVGLRLKVVMMRLRESCCQWSNQGGLSIVELWVPRRLVTEIESKSEDYIVEYDLLVEFFIVHWKWKRSSSWWKYHIMAWRPNCLISWGGNTAPDIDTIHGQNDWRCLLVRMKIYLLLVNTRRCLIFVPSTFVYLPLISSAQVNCSFVAIGNLLDLFIQYREWICASKMEMIVLFLYLWWIITVSYREPFSLHDYIALPLITTANR